MSLTSWSWQQFENCLAESSAGPDVPSPETTVLQIGGPAVSAPPSAGSCLTFAHPAEAEILQGLPLGLAILASRDSTGRSLTLVRSLEIKDWSALLSWQGLMQIEWKPAVADPLPSLSLPSLILPSSSRATTDRINLCVNDLQNLSLSWEHRLVLEAGLRLLNDDGEGSHECAQQLEGQGQYRTADYWHAILHRREPDYDNARYWFRRVGSHPVQKQLSYDWTRITSSLPADAELPLPLQRGVFSSDLFVQACEKARHASAAHRALLEELQYREMLRLLVWSWAQGA